MSQSRYGSAIETVCSVGIGYCVAIISQIAIFPLFNINVSTKENFLIALYFTVISLIRGYFVRQMFNGIFQNGKHH